MDIIRKFSTLTQTHPIWTLCIFTLMVFVRFSYIKSQKKVNKDWWRKIDLDSFTRNPLSIILEKLPLGTKRILAYLLFIPTLLFNLFCSYFFPSSVYSWYNRIDDSFLIVLVIVGALPFYTTVPELYQSGVGGVVNSCDEYGGPVSTYEKYGIQQLYLPVIDYTSPSESQIDRCVDFCEKIVKTGKSVLIHCKAGKGRSVTFAVCYLMKAHQVSAQEALRMIIRHRPQVCKYVWNRECVAKFASKHNLQIRENNSGSNFTPK